MQFNSVQSFKYFMFCFLHLSVLLKSHYVYDVWKCYHAGYIWNNSHLFRLNFTLLFSKIKKYILLYVLCHWQNALQCWIEWQQYYMNSYVQTFFSIPFHFTRGAITLIVKFLANIDEFCIQVPNIALHLTMHITLTVYNLNFIQILWVYILLRNWSSSHKWKCPYSSLFFWFHSF